MSTEVRSLILLLALIAGAIPLAAQPTTTSFTYQGELQVEGAPANGEFDFMFFLFDASTFGNQVSTELLFEDVEVRSGLFTVLLDYGSVFDGNPLWLEIHVIASGDLGPFEVLQPRHPITPAPGSVFSLEAENADTVDGREAFDLEIQDLALVGTELRITQGSTVFSQDLMGLITADADADPTNELITSAQLTGDQLEIVENGTVTNVADLSTLENSALTLVGTDLQLTDGGGTLSADLSALGDDADADPTNELNTGAALVGTTLNITDAGGNVSADLSPLVDADGDSGNELNTTLELSGSTLELTDAGGTLTADLSALPGDGDADPSNELITSAQLDATNFLEVVEGGTFTNLVDLTPLENSGLALVGTDLQITDGAGTLSADLSALFNSSVALVGTDLQITDGAGTLSTSLASLVNDADADPANELNTAASLIGSTLRLTDAGGDLDVDLSSLGGSDTAAEILAKLTSVDGSGSGLDADLLDGLDSVAIIQQAAVGTRTEINSLPFVITEPGSYVMTQNLTSTVVNDNGIIIDSDNVTLDLGGFTLEGNSAGFGGDGILILGLQTNIYIYNGMIRNWRDEGINGVNVSGSRFERLNIIGNDTDGMIVNDGNVIAHVVANHNGNDGIDSDDGTVIVNCSAMANGDNGIEGDDGCTIIGSAGYLNEGHGVEVGDGGLIVNSSGRDNGTFGIEANNGSAIYYSTADLNTSNGINITQGCLVVGCAARNNGGNGIRAFSTDSLIRDSRTDNNALAGFTTATSDVVFRDNHATDNTIGFQTTAGSGSFFIRNTASGNNTNYSFTAGTSFGPIIDVSGGGDISGIAGADHPWANFSF
ncbi:MAG: hypothetical protein MPN21_28120 [Thermoanaerobaculia bacterium]|nr:hypothetical protein [Thermoanaerobaculia bacterium]